MLKDKKIILGISGGIAAYKCPELARHWVREGAEIEVVMTRAAMEFVTLLTMETICGRKVHHALFPKEIFSAALHIDLVDWCDVLFIAPATANIIAKMRHGIADDLLSTICQAGWRKTIVAPAMNVNMWDNPATQENVSVLKKRGYMIIEPDKGDLACGDTGVGRLPDTDVLDYWLRYYITPKKKLLHKHIIITAGRTDEPLDPVRIFTNRSSARMGFALAQQAFFRGGRVTLIAGPNNLRSLPGITSISVETAQQMADAVNQRIADADVLIAAAAVSDYRPAKKHAQKIKKSPQTYTISMVTNPDILGEARAKNARAVLVGFALETENALENASEKLKSKQLDLIAVNHASAMAADSNALTLLYKNGRVKKLKKKQKAEAAEELLNEVERLVQR
jgi:phosphopantothenoylcysteine decarboxylase/phosphopantothenate--cysteine ligase